MKVTGKDLEFWFDGVEEPIISIKGSTNYGTQDSTDTATPSDGKDFEVIRADRSYDIESNFYTLPGVEIITGTLIAGKRYRVTAVDTVLAAYEIGKIFESDGTEVMSATDSVVPLGDKNTGKTMVYSFDGNSVPCSSVDYNIIYDELDVSDNETTGDGKETIVSRAERETKLSLIMRSEDADLLTENPVPTAAVITFASGQTVTGTVIPISKEPSDESVGKAEVNYTFKWKGKPIEVALGIAPATEKAFKVIYKRGATTNKATTGNGIITKKSISVNFDGLCKITQTMKVNGQPTYAVAN